MTRQHLVGPTDFHSYPNQSPYEPIDKIIGQRLRQVRESYDLSQRDCAAIMGITYRQIQRIEAGQNRLGFSRLIAFLRATKMGPMEFLQGIL